MTERDNSAALSNYRVLCNNIAYLSAVFEETIGKLRQLQSEIVSALNDDTLLNAQYKSGATLNAFVPIVSRIQLNSLSIFQKLAPLTRPDDRKNIDLKNVSALSRGFDDYNNLVTTTRQYIDSTVSASYQLYLLDPKAFNYHVLVSLSSFSKYATKSLTHTLFNSDVKSALSELEKLEFRHWANSRITACKHPTFGHKIDFLFSKLGSSLHVGLADDLKKIFKFSSEFTHVGYISTFFTSTAGAEYVFGDTEGPYLVSTENFSELKFEILETANKTLADLYIPSLIKCVEKIFLTHAAEKFVKLLRFTSKELSKCIRSRSSEKYFFIKTGLIGSDKKIPLNCACGTTTTWMPPHNTSELSCESCGASFTLLEVKGNGGSHVMTSEGPAKIVGVD